MYLPNARAIESFQTVLPEIEALLFEWFDRCDRHAPVPLDAVAEVDEVLAEARRLLSRVPGRLNIERLSSTEPVSSASCFIALLKAREALWAYANRYSYGRGPRRNWHHPLGARCPLCHTPGKMGEPLGDKPTSD